MLRLLGLLFVCGCFAGCGGPSYPTATLQGQVTVDGKPIPDGTLSITPLTGNRGQGMSTSIRAGKYHVEGVPQGRVRVDFNAVQATGKTVLVFDRPEPEMMSLIPEAYRSGLEIEVKGEKMDHDFQLTSAGAPARK